MNKLNIVKKISVGTLVGTFKTDLPADNTPLELGRVIGMARGTKQGESQFGPWTALTGDFVFIPSRGPKEGQRFRSGTLFVPDVVLDLVVPAVEGLEPSAGAEMAFSISAMADSNSSPGYVYTAEFLMEPAENDPLEALMARALPAPKAGEKTQGEEKPSPKGK